VKVAIDFRAPTPHYLEMEISEGRTSFTFDGQKFPFSPAGYEMSAVRREVDDPSEADQTFIAKCLGIDEIEVQALADYVRHPNGTPGQRVHIGFHDSWEPRLGC
jgi:hypothetical protein